MMLYEHAVAGVRALTPYQPGKPIEELERELGVSNTLKLASNENPLGASPEALEALSKPLAELAFYPDGNGFILKQKLAEILAVNPTQITLGNGSNDVLDLIARTFLNHEREAIFSEYAFAVYPIVTQAVGATAKVAAAFSPEHPMAYGHNLDTMSALISDKTSVIFIANPNNPTGTWLTADELEGFIRSVPQHIVVVIDEAYFEYVQTPEYPDALAWVDDYPNLIITRTFSKIYGLAGLRVGYAVSHEGVADLLNRVRQPFNVNSVALSAATAALEDAEHIQHSREENAKGLAFLQQACKERDLESIPSVGNFLTLKMPKPALEVYQALLHEAIIVRPVANYNLPEHLRVTIGSMAQNQRFLEALDKVLGL